MKSSKPAIVIVPGAWQRAVAFESFAKIFINQGYPTEVVSLPSVGGTSIPLPGLTDDVKSVRRVIAKFLDESKEVILLCHSYGGLVGSQASQDLDVVTRSKIGKLGGIRNIVYISAFVVPIGKSLFDLLGGQPTPWMEVQGDKIIASSNMLLEVGFNDLSLELAAIACQQMTHSSASVFLTPSEYEPWANSIPCAYIVTSEDNALPPAHQNKMAKQLGPEAKLISMKTGHCPFLSAPDQLVEAIGRVSGITL